MHPFLVVIFSGILPFGAVSVELFFIMSAVWLHQYFYLFGALVYVFLLLYIYTHICTNLHVLLMIVVH